MAIQTMKVVVFGLAVSSSWGNGHATLWRGLGRALSARGHRLVFFERDVPYYAAHRDATAIAGVDLRLYRSWDETQAAAALELADADLGMVTSFCPDAPQAEETLLSSRARIRCFYDLDTPVTLAALSAGGRVAYLGERGLRDYDLVLSYTGGRALDQLRERLGAQLVEPLYGSVDPQVHRPDRDPPAPFRSAPRPALSYLGTYAPDRQPALDQLFLRPAERRPARRFVIGGAQYPTERRWPANVEYVGHVAPAGHPAFYGTAALTLNVTRAAMAAMGHCPSARLFEAAACGVPVVSDAWEGIERFFQPGEEILLATCTEEILAAIDRPERELSAIGRRARERALADHTADRRALDLERILERSLGQLPRAAAAARPAIALAAGDG
jgi:spore maturation protein CgeB